MPPRDYYVVLGIPRTETNAGIRAAYRDLAKRYHPDVAGEEDVERFREIVEAYRVLGDPDARRVYDDRFTGSERIARARWQGQGRAGRAAEPLVSRPLDLFAQPDEIRPSAEALRARIRRNFSGRDVPKSERLQALTCNVVLSRWEAARGGLLPIQVPLLERCPTCAGAGRTALFRCIDCDATGYRERRGEITIRIPPGVAPETRITARLDALGIANLVLEVLVRVGG